MSSLSFFDFLSRGLIQQLIARMGRFLSGISKIGYFFYSISRIGQFLSCLIMKS